MSDNNINTGKAWEVQHFGLPTAAGVLELVDRPIPIAIPANFCLVKVKIKNDIRYIKRARPYL